MPEPEDRKSVRVTIFGRPYTLVAREDPQKVQVLAQSLDMLMHELAAKTGQSDPLRVAILACMHLADRLQQLEEQVEALRTRLDEQTRKIDRLLREALGEEQWD